MPGEKDKQVATREAVALSPSAGPRRAEAADKSDAGTESRSGPDRVLGGLERIREILLGDILGELERRLVRIDSQLANRTSELQQDARRRTDVLDAHVRKEVEALSARAAHDGAEVNDAVRHLRRELREALAGIEQRLTGIEDRVEASVGRVERETRQQLLDQAKSFLNELEHVRHQLRAALVREFGLEPALEEGVEHDAGAWAAPH